MREIGALLGQQVAKIRKERGMTQAELTRRMAEQGHPLHQTAITKLETGKRPVTVDEAVALAEILDVSTTALIPDNGHQQSEGLSQMDPHPRNARIILALDHLTLGDLEWFTATARNANLDSEDRIGLDLNDDGETLGIVIETSTDLPA